MKKFIMFLFTLCVIALVAMFALKTIQPPESGSDGSSTESVFKPSESKPNESTPNESGSDPSIDVGDYEDWILTLDWDGSGTPGKEFTIPKDMWKKKTDGDTEEVKVSKIVLSVEELVFGD